MSTPSECQNGRTDIRRYGLTDQSTRLLEFHMELINHHYWGGFQLIEGNLSFAINLKVFPVNTRPGQDLNSFLTSFNCVALITSLTTVAWWTSVLCCNLSFRSSSFLNWLSWSKSSRISVRTLWSAKPFLRFLIWSEDVVVLPSLEINSAFWRLFNWLRSFYRIKLNKNKTQSVIGFN